MAPTAGDIALLVRSLYKLHSVGCCLHVAIDDGNLSDGDIEGCIQRARERDHRGCETIGALLSRITETEREQVYDLVHPRPDACAVCSHSRAEHPDINGLEKCLHDEGIGSPLCECEDFVKADRSR